MQQELLRLEEQFWKADVDFYRERLAEDALMVFADPVGTLDRAATLTSLDGSPRWTDVVFEEVRVLALATDVALLTYRARAVREGGGSYRTRASSGYRRTGGHWMLAFHQQTPLP